MYQGIMLPRKLSIYKEAHRWPKFCNNATFHLTKKYFSSLGSQQSSQNKSKMMKDQSTSIYEKYIQFVKPEYRNKVLQNYMSLNVDEDDPYLVSKDVAKDFVNLIKSDLLRNMSHVIELNPGFGLLTEELLKGGVPFLHLYEKEREFLPELQILRERYPNRFTVQIANLFRASRIVRSSIITQECTNICKVMDNLPQEKWQDEACMQIIGTTTKNRFIRYLIMTTVFRNGFMTHGRPVFYLALAPSVWDKHTSGKKMSSTYVIFTTLFNYKMLGMLDRKAFVPWKKKKRCKRLHSKYLLEKDCNFLFVVKLEPKRDLFTLFNGKGDLIHFWHFIRHHLQRSSQRVIPALEKIIPGCGIRLIQKNYTVYTEFNDLNCQQIYDLYMEFKSWPEVHESSFLLGAADVTQMYAPYQEEEDE